VLELGLNFRVRVRFIIHQRVLIQWWTTSHV